jgi:hypothetical protein
MFMQYLSGFCGIGRVGMIIEITYMWDSIF